MFTAEMDALPGLGHACGHNIIAAAGTYAAVVLKSVIDPKIGGTIEVVGTPAEESGSGKVRMIQEGIFKNSDVVLQGVHPHSLDTVVGQALARRTLVVEYFGRRPTLRPHRGKGSMRWTRSSSFTRRRHCRAPSFRPAAFSTASSKREARLRT